MRTNENNDSGAGRVDELYQPEKWLVHVHPAELPLLQRLLTYRANIPQSPEAKREPRPTPFFFVLIARPGRKGLLTANARTPPLGNIPAKSKLPGVPAQTITRAQQHSEGSSHA